MIGHIIHGGRVLTKAADALSAQVSSVARWCGGHHTGPAPAQRSFNLAVPRAVVRATSGLATGPTHLASRDGNIAPRARHLRDQRAVTATLGRVAVVVAPASATTSPARATRPEPCACLYYERHCYCCTKYPTTQAPNALFAQVSSV